MFQQVLYLVVVLKRKIIRENWETVQVCQRQLVQRNQNNLELSQRKGLSFIYSQMNFKIKHKSLLKLFRKKFQKMNEMAQVLLKRIVPKI